MEKKDQDAEKLHDGIIAEHRYFSGNYTNASLRSMKLVECTFKGTIFNDAAVTGAKFEKCVFEDCQMDQSDFEYCDFFGCTLTSNLPICISFNNSNFINTDINGLNFTSSTFTNAFFDEVRFSGVTINNCTLEAVSFYHCQFPKTTLTNINLDFSEFIDPDFQDCIFPQAQIPRTYGLIQYMMSAEKPIELGDYAGNKTMDSVTYINQELPRLLKKFVEADKMNQYKDFFSIINILLAYKEKEEAFIYLKKAFKEAALIEDLRMIRYYCKLISFCQLYSLGERRKLYRDICSYFHMKSMSPWKLKNYSRQMGEIRYTLLMENSLPTLIFYAATNLVNECISKVGTVMEHIFTISEKHKKSPLHDMRVEITRNSPIHLTIYFTETIENVAALFKDLKGLCGAALPKMYSTNELSVQNHITDDIRHYIELYTEQDINLEYIGFQIENWRQDYSEYLQIEG